MVYMLVCLKYIFKPGQKLEKYGKIYKKNLKLIFCTEERISSLRAC